MVSFEEMKDESQKWANEYCQALNNSQMYEEAAKGWGVGFEGSILIKMTAQGEVEEDIVSFLDLKDGKCLGITLIEPGQSPPREPGFVLEGTFSIWRDLAFKKIDPVQALMTQKLKLTGDMGTIMKFSKAAVLLAEATEKTDRSIFTKYDLGD
ncbi:MAG: SCP2 sterol-binding domain-containing protein [Candidatus Helarchaeota archaeon]